MIARAPVPPSPPSQPMHFHHSLHHPVRPVKTLPQHNTSERPPHPKYHHPKQTGPKSSRRFSFLPFRLSSVSLPKLKAPNNLKCFFLDLLVGFPFRRSASPPFRLSSVSPQIMRGVHIDVTLKRIEAAMGLYDSFLRIKTRKEKLRQLSDANNIQQNQQNLKKEMEEYRTEMVLHKKKLKQELEVEVRDQWKAYFSDNSDSETYD
ncbi:hypothetical protein DEO72_LG5g2500 [Vigna unguiculata]|uniref:Uncharacterized protein n=1 Tax=Vigna unguiculata TaxID=3917 RepID=A0A4D6M2K1_VIGUN|nr:hypothetical protein DEO72_LG5g2500 [Vigna unguiculata]